MKVIKPTVECSAIPRSLPCATTKSLTSRSISVGQYRMKPNLVASWKAMGIEIQTERKMNMQNNTIRLHRVLRAAPEKIYKAFLDPDAMAKWLPPNGFTAKVQKMDAKVGGTYKMSFTNFTTGKSHSFGGTYVELTPHERIRYTDKFDDPNLPGEMQTTITLTKVSCGTDLNIVQEGVPSVIPAEACYLGWQESLALLAKLVEPEIPD
jgi:uncharacterized protein YndB with AHSA1/START domain